MNKNAIIRVLEYVNQFNLFISLERVKDYILHSAKSNRKGLTKDEIIEKGLNIYLKTGISIDSLLEIIINEEYVEVKQDAETEICLTLKGLKTLMELYTNNYCEEFLNFQKEVNAVTEKRNETNFDPVHIAAMYYHKDRFTDIEKLYFKEQTLQEETQAYHNYLLSIYGLQPSENEILFHMIPKIFLPIEDMSEDIELTIEGLDLLEPMILSRPYPNQRYVVAGIKRGREKITTGFYPIIATKEDFPKEKDIRYHWKLGNGKEFIHDIHIAFQIDRGNLFSTEQSLSRSNCLPYFRVCTFYEDVPLIGENRRIEYHEKNENFIHMKETITLTSFPTHLHSCFYADSSFEKWRDKRKVKY